MVAGHSGQFTPGGYLSSVKHTALAGIEPTTFRLLVRRATSRATKTTETVPDIFEGYYTRICLSLYYPDHFIVGVMFFICTSVCLSVREQEVPNDEYRWDFACG